MIRLGLTGSIGMGKSTVARMFADEGVPVFDADAVVHRLQGPEGALVAQIEAHFPGTTGAAGVNRTALAEAVLGESEKLRRLEGLIHPAVARERETFLAANRDAPLVLLDIPLLFEKGGWDQVDRIAVVSAPAEMQRERVLARPGMTRRKGLAPTMLSPPASILRRPERRFARSSLD
jgi:dephospho-CoA kinase